MLFALLLALPLVAFSGEKPHCAFADSSTAALFAASPFAHGFIHGYADGFRIADAVYQTGRHDVDITKLHEYQHADSGYERADSSSISDSPVLHSPVLHSKDDFRQGYRAGFQSGYQDSINNRAFRAVAAARHAADGLGPQMPASFDEGFRAGFLGASESSPDQGKSSPPEKDVSSAAACQAFPAPGAAQPDPQFCSGLFRGRQFFNEAGVHAPRTPELLRAAR